MLVPPSGSIFKTLMDNGKKVVQWNLIQGLVRLWNEDIPKVGKAGPGPKNREWTRIGANQESSALAVKQHSGNFAFICDHSRLTPPVGAADLLDIP